MGTRTGTRRPPITDYRVYLDERIAQAKRRVKSADAGTGIAIVVAAWINYVLLLVMVDQLIELPAAVRLVSLLALILATGAILVHRVILPAFLKVNALFAARSVESVDPRMKNSVSSWVDISKAVDNLPEPVVRTIGNRAATDLSRVRIEDAIQPRHVLTSLYILAAVVILFCGFSFFTTKSFGPTVHRVLFPLAGTTPPTATHLRITFDPSVGDGRSPAPIPVGGSLTVKARAERGNPERVVAYLQADGSDYEEPHELDRVDATSKDFVLALHRRQKSFHMRLVADDFQSETFTVTVTPAPTIVDWNVFYEPPAYTGLSAYSSKEPDIDGLEGTRVRIEATANGIVESGSGRLDIRNGDEQTSLAMPSVDGTSNRIAGELTLKDDGSYSVLFRDGDGRTPDFRPNNHIRVRRDLPPTIEFAQPAEKEIEWPANQPLVIRARVTDDFGLRKVAFELRDSTSDEILLQSVAEKPGELLGKSHEIESTADLATLRVEPGDLLEYWIESDDNKLPVANFSTTKPDRRLIRIVEPVSDQPKQDKSEQDQPQNQQEQSDGQGEAKEGQSGDAEPQDNTEQGSEGGQSSGQAESGTQQGTPGDETSNEAGNSGSDSDSSNKGQQSGQNADANNDSNASGGDSNLSEEDQQSLDKLKEYFDKQDQKEGSNESKRNESKQDASESKTNESSSDPSQSDRSTDANSPQAAQDNSPSDPTSEATNDSNSPKDQQNQADSGESKDSHPSESKNDSNESGSRKQDAGQDRSDRTNEGTKPNQSGDQPGSQFQPDATRSEDQQPSDPAAKKESSTKQDSSTGDSNKQEQEGSNRTTSGQPGQDDAGSGSNQNKEAQPQQAENGAGKAGDSGDAPRPDNAQPGDPSRQDNGEAGNRADDQTAKAGSEKKDEQQNPDGSHKDGNDKSSAASAANSEGEANQGESSTAGQSSTGSPTEEKGDNSNSTGDQKAKGQSRGEGDRQQGQQSASDAQGQEPGESGKENENPGSKPGNGKEGADAQNSGQQSKETADSAEGSQSRQSADDTQRPADQEPQDQVGDQSNSGGQPGDGNAPPEQSTESNPGGADGSGNLDPTSEPKGSAKDNSDLDNSGDKANPDDRKKGSNLVLRKLEEELKKKQVDPELLKRMGWTEEDARQFYERYREQAAREATAEPLTGKKRQGFGQGTDLRSRSQRSAGQITDTQQGLESGRRTAVPPEIRKRYEAYTKSLSEAGDSKSSATPPPQKQ